MPERELQLIIDTMPVLAWSANAAGAADFFSQRYLNYTGKTHDCLCDWQWISLVHPEDLNAVSAAWETCRANGTDAEVEARLVRHDGEYRWFLFQTSGLADANGKIVKWYGVNTDIEDRKRAEQALAAREHKLREALDHLSQAQRLSHTGSFTIDMDTDTHVLSDELYRILEYDREVPPTLLLFRDRIHPDDLSVFDASYERSVLAQTEFDEVFRIITSKGNTRYLHAVAHFVKDNADRLTAIGSIQDITESKRTEDELRRNASFLAAGERLSLTGSLAWDIDSVDISYSEQLRLIHELDDNRRLTVEDFIARIHPDDLPIFQETFSALNEGQDIDCEMRLLMPDGRIRHTRSVGQMMQQPDGTSKCVGAVQDVTRRRTAEEALDRVRSELAHMARVMSLGELAASIAHEVNQPLSGIITNANTCLRMLACDPPNVEGAIATAQRTVRDGNRASEVIRRLHPLFRKSDYVAEPVDLNQAAQEVIALSLPNLQRRGIMLQAAFADGLPSVSGDRIQLQQVILNLVLNAADAVDENAPATRQIFIETREADPGTARLEVRDTGRGLAVEDLGRIFEAFYTTKPQGMGIGLSVSKSIIERHDGELWAQPNSRGGAIFVFTIPYARDVGRLPDEQAG